MIKNDECPTKSGKTQGPLCRICKKPFSEHSFQQQQECAKKMKDKDQ